jgi:hypothetical protein
VSLGVFLEPFYCVILEVILLQLFLVSPCIILLGDPNKVFCLG